MNGTIEQLHAEGQHDLDSAALERALAELWQQAAAGSDGPPVARARVMTLVVYTEDEESLELAGAVADLLPEHHPSRGVLVHVHPDEELPMRATLDIRCMVNPRGERKICSERITVTAGGSYRALLADAVAPLIVPDLPAVVWWTGRPRPADPVFRRFASRVADRLLVDSALFRDPGAGLIALDRWRRDPRRRAAVADLAWERVRPWRQLLAQTLDGPEGRAALRGMAEIAIGYHGPESLAEEALLLAGWLAACLGWRVEDSPAHGVVALADRGSQVIVRLRHVDQEQPLPGIVSVRMRARDGSSYTVRTGDQPGIGVCLAEGGARPAPERLVPLLRPEPLALVIGALGRAGHDPVYDAALGAAAEIALLGVTA